MEAAPLPGMTGDPFLMDREENRITIAIQGNRSDPLSIAGTLTFHPDRLTTSTEIGRSTTLDRESECFAIEIGEHQDLFALIILDDYRKQGVFTLESIERSG